MLVSRKTLQSEFSLAYAMTVHKSQGSEFKAVVIGLEKAGHGYYRKTFYILLLREPRRNAGLSVR